MEFRLLGPLEICDGAVKLDVGTARTRTLLAVLLTPPGQLVSVERLVDELWPDAPPPDARTLIHSYISRLRRVLRSGPTGHAAGQLLVTRKPGYLLRVDEHELDLVRYQRLLAEARKARPQDRVGLLRRADLLWRGPPFADAPATPTLAAAAAKLSELRLTALEEQFAAALDTGDAETVVAELTGLVTVYPLRERLAGQLVLALYHCGRQAEALEQYQRIRRTLADEVGVDPGAELRQIHRRILNADPTLGGPTEPPAHVETTGAPVIARTPRQLPRDLPTVVGRIRELADLGALLEADAASGAGPVVVLHGAPGAGKSALAVHAAHRSAARFPDGQLHVNLRGATPAMKPLTVAEALHQLLRSLGIAGTDVPAGVDEAAGLLRTVVAGRRLLLVLDNAATTAQVRPLLPGCAVLITSRTRLVALEGATRLHVGPLGPGAANAMLNGLITGARPAADPGATRRLADLCDHLPLALQVAAARLNARPHWAVSDLVDRLAGERDRLTELAAGDVALRSSLAVSHTALLDSDNPTDRRAAHALCLLGLLPIADVDLHLVAAVLDTSPADADRTIERLTDAHLVEETALGRFHLHDLTRLFAQELGDETIPATEQHAAFTRLLDHYLATTRQANTLAYPHRAHHPVPDVHTIHKPLAGHDEALQWLDEQRHNMIEVIQRACRGPVEHARLGVGLALALHWYLHSGASDLSNTISFQHGVVTAAERLGDRRSQAYAHGNLAVNLRHIGQFDQACSHSAAELAICREIGDRFGEQRALGNLGHTQLAQQRPDQAIVYLRQQLDLAREIDAPIGQAFALVNLGKANHQLGRSSEAITMIETGLAWYEQTGDRYRQCDVHEILARVHIDLGHYEQAIALMTRGLHDARHIGYRFGEVWALTTLAKAHRLSGNTGKAQRYAEQAVAASDSLHGTQARTDALSEHAQLFPNT